MKSYSLIRKSKHQILNIITWSIVFLVNFPLLWMFSTSIKPNPEIFIYPPTLITRNPTITNFIELFKVTNFARYFLNSTIVAVITVAITIIIATMAAYAFTRFRIRGAAFLSRTYILVYLIPRIALVIPIFLTIKYLNLVNTLTALVIVYLISTFPYSFLMLRSYIGGFGKEMEEAAMVDGCTRFGAFIRILLPVAMPGIVATSIFTAVICWNEYLFTLILIQDDAKRTLTVGVANLTDKSVVPSWGMLMAAAVIVVIPMLIFFVVIQRKLVVGLSAGAIKG